MIAIDTSSLVAYLGDESGKDVDYVDQALESRIAVFPPVVITEILTEPHLTDEGRSLLLKIPILEIGQEFWIRAGISRSLIVKNKLKARLADTLIAQSCIDHNIPLITRDSDFRHFEKYCGLRLLK